MNAKKIYYIKSINELLLIKNFKKNDWKYLLHYYIILDEYEKMYECIEKLYNNKKLTIKDKNILNYYLGIYYLHKNEKYKMDKIYYRLNNIYKVKMDFNKCTYVHEYNELFDNKFIEKKNYYKYYGDTYYFIYLCNYLRNNVVINISLNKKIVKYLKKIVNKKELSLYDIDFLCSIISITYNYYTIFLSKGEKYPIDLSLLHKISDKLVTDIDKYGEVLKNIQIKYNELIILGYRAIITLEKNIEMQKKALQSINNFIETHEFDEYTKFIHSIANDKDNSNVNIKEYVETIKNIANGGKGEILRTILIYGAFSANLDNLLEFYNEIKDIECNCNSEKVKSDLLLGKSLLRFWCGERIDIDFSNPSLIMNEFLKLLIDYDNQRINYKEFLYSIQEINEIDSSLIMNWDRFNLLFDKYDYRWLEILIGKCDNINSKCFNYLIQKYIKILNGEINMDMNRYNNFNSIILNKIDNVDIKILCVIISLRVYNNYDKFVIDMINNIFDNYKDISINDDIVILLIISIIICSIYDDKKVDTLKLNKLINKYMTSFHKSLCKICLYYIDKSAINSNLYNDALNELNKVYINDCNLNKDTNVFSLISVLSTRDLINKDPVISNVKDIIYLNDVQMLVLEDDYIKEYEKYYNSLKIKKVETIDDESKYEKTSLLEIFISKIYFANIELFGAGKIIRFSKNLLGKELMNELLNAIGYREEQAIINKIKNGEKISGLWLNSYNLHQYMKDVKSKIDFKYKNSVNGLLNDDKKIIHITSLVLLAKLNILDRIVGYDKYYVTSYTFDKIEKMKKDGSVDLIDGVIEEAICYDDLIDSIFNTLINLEKNSQIEYVSSANILGIRDYDKINKFDLDFFKLLVYYNENPFKIITEDSYYFNTEFFNSISNGTYSLIVDMYVHNLISSNELLNLTIKLEEENYNLNVKKDIFYYLLNKSDDDNISQVVDILNKE